MKIDLQAIYKLEGETLQKMDEIKNFIQYQAEQAVAFEKANHLYKNRTGNLERSTIAEVTADNFGLFEVSLQMQMEYASYVYDKGLTVIDLAMSMAQQNIEAYL